MIDVLNIRNQDLLSLHVICSNIAVDRFRLGGVPR